MEETVLCENAIILLWTQNSGQDHANITLICFALSKVELEQQIWM